MSKQATAVFTIGRIIYNCDKSSVRCVLLSENTSVYSRFEYEILALYGVTWLERINFGVLGIIRARTLQIYPRFLNN